MDISGREQFDRLIIRAMRSNLMLLCVGVSALILIRRGDLALSYALGTVLGILNFYLHSRGVIALTSGDQSRAVHPLAVIGFVGRFAMLAVVIGTTYLFLNLRLIPALVGLLGTYAVLVCVGIMSSGKVPIGEKEESEGQRRET